MYDCCTGNLTDGPRMGPRFDDTRPAWDQLEERVEKFIGAWSSTPEPPIDPHLPQEPSALRRMVLIELIKVDFDQRLERGLRVGRVEDYVAAFPELAEGGVPPDLLYEEFFARKRLGERVPLDDYRRRFPEQAEQLQRMLGGSSTYKATTLCAPKSAVGFQAGDMVDDFELKAQLGEGAFAKVFLAYQKSMQRLVALKISADRGEEPQTLAQLNHPHIVRVFDQRRLPQQNQRLLYMEFLAGGTLLDVLDVTRDTPRSELSGKTLLAVIERMLKRRGADAVESPARRLLESATWPQAVAWIGARLADALAAAHSRGVLHRDIKPANVLLGADASPRLADFNVGFCSKLTGASPHTFFGGSLIYMSPEQMEAYNPAHERSAAELDGRSDLFSLGVTLWELLTGNRPYTDDRMDGPWAAALLAVTNRRRGGVPTQARSSLPADCPQMLVRALERCLDPDPDQRFPDASSFARVLDLALFPRTQRLLNPPAGDWRLVARRFPLSAMLATGLLPNALAGWFNFSYNYSEVIKRLDATTPGLRQAFLWIQTAINCIAFPLGVGLFMLVAGSVLRALRSGPQAIDRMESDELAQLRHKTLQLGHYGVWIGVGLWLGASLMYPLALRWMVPELPRGDFLDLFWHFIASLTICGLIAGAYPFFLGSALGTSSFYPAFVRPGSTTPHDVVDLIDLERALWPHLALAAAVPLVGMLALFLVGTESRWPVVTLCAAGLAGLGVAVALMRRIQRDIADLGPAVGQGDPRADSVYVSRG
jgi:serine/threonine protein kinase